MNLSNKRHELKIKLRKGQSNKIFQPLAGSARPKVPSQKQTLSRETKAVLSSIGSELVSYLKTIKI